MSIRKYMRANWRKAFDMLRETIQYNHKGSWESYGWLRKRFLFAKTLLSIYTHGGEGNNPAYRFISNSEMFSQM